MSTEAARHALRRLRRSSRKKSTRRRRARSTFLASRCCARPRRTSATRCIKYVRKRRAQTLCAPLVFTAPPVAAVEGRGYVMVLTGTPPRDRLFTCLGPTCAPMRCVRVAPKYLWLAWQASAEKICFLRSDSLARLLTHANLHASSSVSVSRVACRCARVCARALASASFETSPSCPCTPPAPPRAPRPSQLDKEAQSMPCVPTKSRY